MKKNNIYWLCQVTGWGGMVVIETINYTFFIVGKFSIEYFIIFGYSAVVGLFSTHVYKRILCRTPLFQKPAPAIWIVAFISTLVMAMWLTIISLIPSLTSDYQAFMDSLNFINAFGTIMNWMRYVGVWIIIYFMYRLLERNRIVEEDKLKSESMARLVELELLRTQLNPHFLFNALNSIKALVTLDPDKSKDAIVKLSELLRFTLHSGSQSLIPLHDEMLAVKKYLSLEQIRLGERLEVNYEIEDPALTKMIPPAIILTLAENAIKHGIVHQAGLCAMSICAHVVNHSLVIEAVNPGTLKENAGEGIGLRNTRKRLENLFGNKAHFSLAQRDNEVVATITIRHL